MTRDDIMRMAREANCTTPGQVFQFTIEELERFAALVAAHAKTDQINLAWQQGYEAGSAVEREACAEVCEAQRNIEWVRANIPLITHDPANTMASKCAAEIRARGEK